MHLVTVNHIEGARRRMDRMKDLQNYRVVSGADSYGCGDQNDDGQH